VSLAMILDVSTNHFEKTVCIHTMACRTIEKGNTPEEACLKKSEE
jgi:hypothetical protein